MTGSPASMTTRELEKSYVMKIVVGIAQEELAAVGFEICRAIRLSERIGQFAEVVFGPLELVGEEVV